MLSSNPWAEFRQRWRACQRILALGAFSCLMLFSDDLRNAWEVVVLVLVPLFLFFFARVGFLRCPRCELPFYWPPRLTKRIGKCVHCGIWKYDPYNIDGFSERQYLASVDNGSDDTTTSGV